MNAAPHLWAPPPAQHPVAHRHPPAPHSSAGNAAADDTVPAAHTADQQDSAAVLQRCCACVPNMKFSGHPAASQQHVRCLVVRLTVRRPLNTAAAARQRCRRSRDAVCPLSAGPGQQRPGRTSRSLANPSVLRLQSLLVMRLLCMST